MFLDFFGLVDGTMCLLFRGVEASEGNLPFPYQSRYHSVTTCRRYADLILNKGYIRHDTC